MVRSWEDMQHVWVREQLLFSEQEFPAMILSPKIYHIQISAGLHIWGGEDEH